MNFFHAETPKIQSYLQNTNYSFHISRIYPTDDVFLSREPKINELWIWREMRKCFRCFLMEFLEF
jgi:hypothetical protein